MFFHRSHEVRPPLFELVLRSCGGGCGRCGSAGQRLVGWGVGPPRRVEMDQCHFQGKTRPNAPNAGPGLRSAEE
jgi:hypothetical protein